jgi:hypothetical protein
MKTTYVDRDGKLSIHNGFNFNGKIIDLIKILNGVVKEHGGDTTCGIEVMSSFPHRHSTNIVLTNKTLKDEV